ncbi:Uma2 family endonuclease [Planktothrix sp. FACHB-1355]|uniref:Uma2 family endonuclease n=1 Tax=Aerosakkonema funiforme FACHB-1375 TaxID=2949571 RepID=A0A926VB07_9CYAN|nr:MULTISPECIES: Uma2 family endonuclease [Oscillatoriales]MBD2179622.1 Uma2 family endonuclease [Aerosakkonema funiforme FACHB-1375]MBD3562978.1 Uma2 family endonuclease [Planktothrix sp. FACHB-1355]
MVTTNKNLVEQTVPASARESRVVMKGVSWETYKKLMSEVGDDRAWRIAYDRGVLEIRMPLLEHELPKGLLESFIEAIADELGIEVLKAGSLTLEREDLTNAIEPDSCFYIQNEAEVRGREEIILPGDPPPDLAIESDYTSSSVNKQAIYSALGVTELWRYTKKTLLVYRRIEGGYEQCEQSLAFPFLPISEIPSLIEQSRSIGQRSVVRLFRQRIREILDSRATGDS